MVEGLGVMWLKQLRIITAGITEGGDMPRQLRLINETRRLIGTAIHQALACSLRLEKAVFKEIDAGGE